MTDDITQRMQTARALRKKTQALKLREIAHVQASARAAADPTDPFAYSRIYARVMNGIRDEYKDS